MKIISEMSFSDFEPWSGAKDTYNRICDENKESEMESYIEEIFPDGCTDTELNDLLWFDSDNIYEYLGISEEEKENEEENFSIEGARYKVLSDTNHFYEGDIVISLEGYDSCPYCILESDFDTSCGFCFMNYDSNLYESVSMEDLEEI